LSQGQLTDAQQADSFRFQAAKPSTGDNVMTILVWTSGSSARPVAELTDSLGNPVPAEVLASEPGVYVLQVPNAAHDGAYQLKVQSVSGGSLDTYTLAVSFADNTTPLDTLLANQVLADPQPTLAGALHIEQSQLFHLVLTAQPDQAGANEMMVLEITD